MGGRAGPGNSGQVKRSLDDREGPASASPLSLPLGEKDPAVAGPSEGKDNSLLRFKRLQRAMFIAARQEEFPGERARLGRWFWRLAKTILEVRESGTLSPTPGTGVLPGARARPVRLSQPRVGATKGSRRSPAPHHRSPLVPPQSLPRSRGVVSARGTDAGIHKAGTPERALRSSIDKTSRSPPGAR